MKEYIVSEYLKIKKWHFEFLIVSLPILCLIIAHAIAKKIYLAGTVNVSLGELTYTFIMNIFFIFVLPFIVVIFLVMYVYIENANQGWKLVSISGGNLRKLIVAKLSISYLLILVTYIVFGVTIIYGNMHWNLQLDYKSLILQLICSLLGAILNCTFLFLLFHLCQSIVINTLIGVVGVVVNSVIMQTKFWKYFFTTYYFHVNMLEEKRKVVVILICIVGSLVLGSIVMAMADFLGRYLNND